MHVTSQAGRGADLAHAKSQSLTFSRIPPASTVARPSLGEPESSILTQNHWLKRVPLARLAKRKIARLSGIPDCCAA